MFFQNCKKCSVQLVAKLIFRHWSILSIYSISIHKWTTCAKIWFATCWVSFRKIYFLIFWENVDHPNIFLRKKYLMLFGMLALLLSFKSHFWLNPYIHGSILDTFCSTDHPSVNELTHEQMLRDPYKQLLCAIFNWAIENLPLSLHFSMYLEYENRLVARNEIKTHYSLSLQ